MQAGLEGQEQCEGRNWTRRGNRNRQLSLVVNVCLRQFTRRKKGREFVLQDHPPGAFGRDASARL